MKAEPLPASCGSFIPVKMSGKSSVYSARSASAKALCEIEYPNGVVVRVTSDMTLDQLRQMVTLLHTHVLPERIGYVLPVSLSDRHA